MDGFWRTQLGYAVIRRSTRVPRLWWRPVRLNIIWERVRGECVRSRTKKPEWWCMWIFGAARRNGRCSLGYARSSMDGLLACSPPRSPSPAWLPFDLSRRCLLTRARDRRRSGRISQRAIHLESPQRQLLTTIPSFLSVSHSSRAGVCSASCLSPGLSSAPRALCASSPPTPFSLLSVPGARHSSSTPPGATPLPLSAPSLTSTSEPSVTSITARCVASLRLLRENRHQRDHITNNIEPIDHPHSRHHQASGREGLRRIPRLWLH